MAIEIANTAVEICCTLFLSTLLAALLYKRERNRSFLFIVLVFAGELTALITDLLFRWLSRDRPVTGAMFLDFVISYSASVFLVVSFTFYFYSRFEAKGRLPISAWLRWGVLIYGFVTIALFVSSIWTGWFYYRDADGHLAYTEYFNWAVYAFVPLALYDVLIILRHWKILGNTETAVLLLYCVLPIVAFLIDMKYSTVAVHLALTLDACMLYTFIDAEQEQNLIRSRQELAEINLRSLVSQINPHFLYNTLGSIESLMVDRPEEAHQLLSAFSDYLSDNYRDLTKEPLIPIERELQHVEHYLDIAKVRFPNLKVEYNIQAGGFRIPGLSIQPLAENAVKHGICRRRKSAGSLRISTSETPSAWLVRVEDDGVGFDPSTPPKDDRAHVGLENVTKRLSLLCDGTLTVESIPGSGTTCTILIPKGGQRDDRDLHR